MMIMKKVIFTNSMSQLDIIYLIICVWFIETKTKLMEIVEIKKIIIIFMMLELLMTLY